MTKINEDLLEFKDFFVNLKKGLRKEQRGMFFEKENDEEKAEYFSFLKFLFNNPSKA